MQSRVERLSVPDALLTCAEQPEPPPIASQRDVAEYVVTLADAGEDCRSRLRSVKDLMQQGVK